MRSVDRRNFKGDLFDEFARLGKALSNGRRLEILELLAQRERPVEELARMSGVSVANASQHLQILRRAGLVEARRQGLQIYNSLAGGDVVDLWRAMRAVGERRLDSIPRLVRTHLENREALEAVSMTVLRRRLRDGDVILLDVRPVEEFAAGHIPGARNIPFAELESRLKQLPKGVDIVAYCRGPYCVLSDDAVAALRAKGRTAFRLAEGFPDWKAMGFPVAHKSESHAQ